MDELEIRIIEFLCEDARKSWRGIARRLKVAIGTGYNRIARMTEKKTDQEIVFRGRPKKGTMLLQR